MKNTFIVSCPIDTYSGYGSRSRDFIKALVKLNKYDVHDFYKNTLGKSCAKYNLSSKDSWFMQSSALMKIISNMRYEASKIEKELELLKKLKK